MGYTLILECLNNEFLEKHFTVGKMYSGKRKRTHLGGMVWILIEETDTGEKDFHVFPHRFAERFSKADKMDISL